MHKDHTDMLLLNCSNLPWRPIFPYAFVQVSEVARRVGLNVRRLDLLWVENWKEKISELIKRYRPQVIGIHLRQGDSIDLSDYEKLSPEESKYFRSYFPIEDSKRLIRLIRSLSKAPIIMGGFGFTTHAQKLARYLEIDYGVRGCPDGFFDFFNDVLSQRNCSTIPGLVHSNGGKFIFNDVGYFNPAENIEYTDQIVGELKSFYGDLLRGPNPPTVAVEVSRGCPFQCYFCTEPDVKGKRINLRNPEVVEAELEFLLRHDLYDFWFICSELNIGGTDFVLGLAERVVRLNERFNRRQIRWSGYSLPSLKHSELALLVRAGYTGAMNDILSLDDDNLKRAKVPYKKQQAIVFLKSMIELRRQPASVQLGGEVEGDLKFTASTPSQYANLISFFLGNAHADEQTIARTLEAVDREQLIDYYDAGYVIPSTRVFAIGRTSEFIDRSTTISYNRNGETAPDTKLPTFYFPQFLMDRLGSKQAIFTFFDYVTSTLMSRAYLKKINLATFLSPRLEAEPLAHSYRTGGCQVWLQEWQKLTGQAPFENLAACQELLADTNLTDPQRTCLNEVIGNWLQNLFSTNLPGLSSVIQLFGAEQFKGATLASSTYRFTRSAYQRFATMDALEQALAALNSPLARLYADYLLHLNNVQIWPQYKELLYEFDPV